MWLIAAILSAVFAGLTAILAKCGIRKTSSDVATALRMIVVLLFSLIMVLIVGSQGTITDIQGGYDHLQVDILLRPKHRRLPQVHPNAERPRRGRVL